MTASFIYLASGSPRRRALLDQIGVQYQVLPTSVDESVRAGEAPPDYVSRLAAAKAHAGFEHVVALSAAADRARSEPVAVLAADTAVVLGRRILGKPKDRAEGLEMLAALSDRSHHVLTAVALATSEGVQIRLSNSEVTFRALAAAEAEAYWETGEPCDKAGAYGIQGRAAVFIAHLRGSYSGVMGLPLFETAELLGTRGTALAAGRTPMSERQ